MSTNGVRMHGSFNLRGTDTEIHNLELEEVSGDLSNPNIGGI